MTTLIYHVLAWPTLLIALLVFGFAPARSCGSLFSRTGGTTRAVTNCWESCTTYLGWSGHSG